VLKVATAKLVASVWLEDECALDRRYELH